MIAWQRAGELHPDLRLLLRGEDVDDAVEGLGGVVGVHGGEDEVAGLGDGERGRDRVDVAHLADEQHIGVLAAGPIAAPRPKLSVSCPTSRWLTADFLCS